MGAHRSGHGLLNIICIVLYGILPFSTSTFFCNPTVDSLKQRITKKRETMFNRTPRIAGARNLTIPLEGLLYLCTYPGLIDQQYYIRDIPKERGASEQLGHKSIPWRKLPYWGKWLSNGQQEHFRPQHSSGGLWWLLKCLIFKTIVITLWRGIMHYRE